MALKLISITKLWFCYYIMGLLWAHVVSIFICFSFVFSANIDVKKNRTQSFIVRVENNIKPLGFHDVETWYSSILHSLAVSDSSASTTFTPTQKQFLHVYKTVFHGFSAKLTESEAEELKKRPGIVGVFPDRLRQLHTTRTPMFLGLDKASSGHGIEEVSDGGSDVIIGVLDTGIWPEHPSFKDDGLDTVPSRWKGQCEEGQNFSKTLCNKKLIGARYFTNGYDVVARRLGSVGTRSARDTIGHGTHTASTAAGSYIAEASFLGFAKGSAKGMAPKARIAAYKVCWETGCATSDILAGFDKAVEDGVDIISLSLGGSTAYPYEIDPIAIGAYAAMKRGILVSASAGNSGPGRSSVTNTAPWIMTIGASSIDRAFPADLVLEDGQVFTGSSLYNGSWPEDKYVPLIYAGDAAVSSWTASAAKVCSPGAMDPKLVRGSIVICERGRISVASKESTVTQLGGLGVVLANGPAQGEGLMATPHLIAALSITSSNSTWLVDFLSKKPKTKARFGFRGTQVDVKPSPVVTYFSSRGPDRVSSYIMKPDVIAPGLNILAAWPTGLSYQGEFNIISGTSMSCPHVSGIGALLKGAHPEWTPAMIKSALMTTAYSQYNDGGPVLDDFNNQATNPWEMGSGHVDPNKAVEPGLVYDIAEDDYFRFLCASGIGESAIKVITQRMQADCAGVAPEPWNLNYPAIMVVLGMPKSRSPAVEVTRTVTHVGDSPAAYTVAVTPPKGCKVVVEPEKMVFNGKNEKHSYVVKVYGKSAGPEPEVFGKLTWTDQNKKHDVVSPIVVRWSKQ